MIASLPTHWLQWLLEHCGLPAVVLLLFAAIAFLGAVWNFLEDHPHGGRWVIGMIILVVLSVVAIGLHAAYHRAVREGLEREQELARRSKYTYAAVREEAR